MLMVLLLGWKMSRDSSMVFVGYVDGASRHTHNLASTAWVIYSPTGELIASGGACLNPSTNNVVEYSIVIELLRDAIVHCIRSLEVRLDAQLVVCQLNGNYRIHNPMLLRCFLRVHFLEHCFDHITYVHIPRNANVLCDSFSNYVLDWNLHHSR
jgi:ribonuclease HI